jgi:hypothetical protein
VVLIALYVYGAARNGNYRWNTCRARLFDRRISAAWNTLQLRFWAFMDAGVVVESGRLATCSRIPGTSSRRRSCPRCRKCRMPTERPAYFYPTRAVEVRQVLADLAGFGARRGLSAAG